jgi:hypothetical protein
MFQSEHFPRDCVEPHGGQADPVYAASDLDYSTEVAQADSAADAREPIDRKLRSAPPLKD